IMAPRRLVGNRHPRPRLAAPWGVNRRRWPLVYTSTSGRLRMEGVAVRKYSSVKTRNRRSSYPFFLLSSAVFVLLALAHAQGVHAAVDFFLQRQQISAPDTTTTGEAHFGTSVAISGTTALAGAPGAKDDNASSSSGAAYVFATDDNGQWVQKAKLTPED